MKSFWQVEVGTHRMVVSRSGQCGNSRQLEVTKSNPPGSQHTVHAMIGVTMVTSDNHVMK